MRQLGLLRDTGSSIALEEGDMTGNAFGNAVGDLGDVNGLRVFGLCSGDGGANSNPNQSHCAIMVKVTFV